MLAMALFATIMIITTAGFIGINRTYTRGTIRKQLSESVQRVETHIASTLRGSQQAGVIEPCDTGDGGCLASPSGYTALCLTGARYVWGSVADNTGMYTDTSDCTDGFSSGSAVELVDERYVVEELKVNSLPNSLYEIRGTIRTADVDAFTTSSGNVELTGSYEPRDIRCRGSSAGSVVQTCAVEHFSTVVNTRGATL